MADNKRNWVIGVKFDSKGMLSDYERTLKKMSDLDKKYSKGSSSVGGRRSRVSRSAGVRPRSALALGASESLGVRMDYTQSKLRASTFSKEFEQQARDLDNTLTRLQKKMTLNPKGVKRLRLEYADTVTQIKRLERAQTAYNRKLSKSQMIMGKFSKGFKSGGLAGIAAGFVGYAGIKALGGIYRIGRDMDSMRAALLAASGGAEEANKNFAFLKETANRLGRDIQSSVSGFNRIAIAAKSAGLSVKESKNIFLAASEASTAFGLDSQRTGLVMLAFSQMLSKGKVSMEELSRQLGENLPITMKAAEMATGKSTAELIKLIESGKLLSKDFMTPFANAIRVLVREGGALSAGQEKLISQQMRLSNAFKLLIDEIFQDHAAKSFGKTFEFLANILTDISPLIVDISKIFFGFLNTIFNVIKGVYDLTKTIVSLKPIAQSFKALWGGIKVLFFSVAYAINSVLIALYKLQDFDIGDLSTLNSLGKMFNPTGLATDYMIKLFSKEMNQKSGAVSNKVDIQSIQINTKSTDSKGIAREFMDNLSDYISLGS